MVYENANSGLNITDAASSQRRDQGQRLLRRRARCQPGPELRRVQPRARTRRSCATRPTTTSAGPDFGIVPGERGGSNVLVQDNSFWNNSDTGLTVIATSFEVSGNISRDTSRGFYIDDTSGRRSRKMHDNVAWGITNNAFEAARVGPVLQQPGVRQRHRLRGDLPQRHAHPRQHQLAQRHGHLAEPGDGGQQPRVPERHRHLP